VTFKRWEVSFSSATESQVHLKRAATFEEPGTSGALRGSTPAVSAAMVDPGRVNGAEVPYSGGTADEPCEAAGAWTGSDLAGRAPSLMSRDEYSRALRI
jgi:hypothetical protein